MDGEERKMKVREEGLKPPRKKFWRCHCMHPLPTVTFLYDNLSYNIATVCMHAAFVNLQ